MFEFKSRPLGKPMSGPEIREFTRQLDEAHKRMTPEERTQLLIDAQILDENGDINRKLFPDWWERANNGPKPSGGEA